MNSFSGMYRKLYSTSERIVNKFRLFHHTLLLRQFGKGSRILGKVHMFCPERITLGKGCVLNEGVLLNARGGLDIMDNVHLSYGVTVNTGGLDYRKRGKDRTHITRSVVIEGGVWIGSGAIINPGVTIGENSVIGAGALVNHDIPPNSVAVGIPARVIKTIDD